MLSFIPKFIKHFIPNTLSLFKQLARSPYLSLLILRVDSRSFIIRIISDEPLDRHTYSLLMLLNFLPFYFSGLDIDFSRYVLFLINDCILSLQFLLFFKHVLLDINSLIFLQHLFFVNFAGIYAGAIHKVLHLVLFLVLI